MKIENNKNKQINNQLVFLILIWCDFDFVTVVSTYIDKDADYHKNKTKTLFWVHMQGYLRPKMSAPMLFTCVCIYIYLAISTKSSKVPFDILRLDLPSFVLHYPTWGSLKHNHYNIFGCPKPFIRLCFFYSNNYFYLFYGPFSFSVLFCFMDLISSTLYSFVATMEAQHNNDNAMMS